MAITYAVIGVILGAVFYWLCRKVRVFAAWAQGSEPPKEKAVVFMPLTALSLGIAGYLSYEPVEKILACKNVGQPILNCLM